MADYYYLTSEGIKIDFHGEIWSDEHWVYGYEHETNMDFGVIKDISLKPFERTIDLYFRGENPQKTAKARQELHTLVQRDVERGRPGRLYVGDYYMECYITALDDVNASISRKYIHTEAKIESERKRWRKELDTMMLREEEHSDLDFPFEFAFDLGRSEQNTIYNPFSNPVDFLINIYGPAVNPTIIISGHTHKVFVTLTENDFLTIDSVHKTIFKKSYMDPAEVNVFNKRSKEQSIFEKIPVGMNRFQKSAGFEFDITMIDERAEPAWEE